jgi:hypothetical protein
MVEEEEWMNAKLSIGLETLKDTAYTVDGWAQL